MEIKIGNLFDSGCQTLVNTVNCVGVMGKGIALDFKKKYHDMFIDYRFKCDRHEVKPGIPYVYNDASGVKIINFPTKDHWRSPSRLSYVESGLKWFRDNYQSEGIVSVAFPPLGCGNGGLDWEVVGPIMYKYLKDLDIKVTIYAPFGTSQEYLTENYLSNEKQATNRNTLNTLRMNPKWNLILEAIREVNDRRYNLKVGRTIFQKICYVLTRNGVDTDFKFVKGIYGPYSTQAKEAFGIMANNNLIQETQMGKMIMITVTDEFQIDLSDYTDQEIKAMESTVDLFGRMKDTSQVEMVATVLFSYDCLKGQKESVPAKAIYDYVLEWKPRWNNSDKRFDIQDAIVNLAMLNLIKITGVDELDALDTIEMLIG